MAKVALGKVPGPSKAKEKAEKGRGKEKAEKEACSTSISWALGAAVDGEVLGGRIHGEARGAVMMDLHRRTFAR